MENNGSNGANDPGAGTHTAPMLMIKGGVDVNQATEADLAHRVPGIGSTLARAIVQSRQAEGPFLNVYDLARVHGLGPKAFEQMTGLRWREDVHARRKEVIEVVSPDTEGNIRLQDVAARFANLDGFEGCMIVDGEGDVLASCLSSNASPDALGAFAPHLVQRVESCTKMLEAGNVDLVTVFLDDRPYTLIPHRGLVFVAIHEPNKFSRRQIRLAQQVVGTLGNLLFLHRTPAGVG